ncbi:unnamed protein product [Darwinula stevensoni]|uniref:Mitochondrial inner membrane protease ATP23 n=1 Tax=Darwinula stevensoni TaxID=69355 RepID=A0A7R9A3A7_9CRUS|nr:unnamed protein product [Darwinula stevensoni]CAG0890325.1 unnamed protein product [Darwinula stevensoni]
MSEEHQEAKEQNRDEGEKWGYDLYPERKGGKRKVGWWDLLWWGDDKGEIDRQKCERRVAYVIEKSPLIKLMMDALKSSGCEVDIRRHIVCEGCEKTVTGGYDPTLNQIVVCQNMCRQDSVVQGVLFHEMIHMFDYCRNKLDFKNLQHLACTEIRAANLAHCSFMSALVEGNVSPFSIANQHAKCVKDKAIMSVLAVRKVSLEEARNAVESVFPQCYADLEPIGRRLRRNSQDMNIAYMERHYYGYTS